LQQCSLSASVVYGGCHDMLETRFSAYSNYSPRPYLLQTPHLNRPSAGIDIFMVLNSIRRRLLYDIYQSMVGNQDNTHVSDCHASKLYVYFWRRPTDMAQRGHLFIPRRTNSSPPIHLSIARWLPGLKSHVDASCIWPYHSSMHRNTIGQSSVSSSLAW
jgi:hypothetical protein